MGQLINNWKVMERYRRELRKTPTPTETLLWTHLRGSQLAGRKFRRQHSVGVYILDFYCPAERLVVEVDGLVHNQPEAIRHDQERDKTLAQLQIRTIRFTNTEIETEIDVVLNKIKACFTY